MRFNDRAADGQTHSGPLRLRRKERLEYLVRLLRGKPYAGIADGHLKLLVFRSLRPDGQLTRSVHVLHRIDAIDHKVHQHLLQLHAISCNRGKLCRQLRPDQYVVSRGLAAQQNDHLTDDFVYIHQLPWRNTLLEEQAGPADDVGTIGSLQPRLRSRFPCARPKEPGPQANWSACAIPRPRRTGEGWGSAEGLCGNLHMCTRDRQAAASYGRSGIAAPDAAPDRQSTKPRRHPAASRPNPDRLPQSPAQSSNAPRTRCASRLACCANCGPAPSAALAASVFLPEAAGCARGVSRQWPNPAAPPNFRCADTRSRE